MPKRGKIISFLISLPFVIIVTVLFLTLISTAMFHFASDINATVTQTIERRMITSAQQAAKLINARLEASFKYLDSAAAMIAEYDEIQGADALKTFEKITYASPFQRIRIADSNGVAVSYDSVKVDISERGYFEKAMNGESGISESLASVYNEMPIFIIYTPIRQNNMVTGLIYGVYEVSDIYEIAGVNNPDDYISTMIISESGKLVVVSDIHADKFQVDDDMYAFFRGCNYEEGFSGDKIIQDMQNGISGSANFNISGEAYICSYTRSQFKEWNIWQIAPYSIIEADISSVRDASMRLVAIVTVLFSIVLVVIVAISEITKRAITVYTRRLESANARLRVAIEHTTCDLFEYDVNKKIVTFLYELSILPVGEAYGSHTLDELINDLEQKNVANTGELREMFESISVGVPLEYIFNISEGKNVRWIKISIDLQEDSEVAYGTAEDVTDVKNYELMYGGNDRYQETLLHECIIAFEIDLTLDLYLNIFMRLPGRDIVSDNKSNEWHEYTSQALNMAQSIVYKEDFELFNFYSSREYLTRLLKSGRSTSAIEYRMVKPNGEPFWVSSTCHVIMDPSTNHAKAFVYVKDIDERKKRELMLEKHATHDDLTGLLTRASFADTVSDYLGANEFFGMSAFVLLDCDEFKSINDTYGHIKGDEVLKEIAGALSNIVSDNIVVSRFGGDEFAVFVKECENIKAVAELVASVCHEVSKIKIDDERMAGVSAGIAFSDAQTDTFRNLYQHADIALYKAKAYNKGKYIIYDADE